MGARERLARVIENGNYGHNVMDLVYGIIELAKEEIQCPYPEACIKPNPTPELIQGYTAENWQEVIDGGYLCEFSMVDFWTNGHIRIGTLLNFAKDRFKTKEHAAAESWPHCRPAQIKGVMRPIFVEPVDRASMCIFFCKDGYPLNEIRSRASYSVHTHKDSAFKTATKYIEL